MNVGLEWTQQEMLSQERIGSVTSPTTVPLYVAISPAESGATLPVVTTLGLSRRPRGERDGLVIETMAACAIGQTSPTTERGWSPHVRVILSIEREPPDSLNRSVFLESLRARVDAACEMDWFAASTLTPKTVPPLGAVKSSDHWPSADKTDDPSPDDPMFADAEVQLDSPPFTPPALLALAERQFVRKNRWAGKGR